MRGSSPRMRGAPLEADPSASGHRIIPAYAGSTQTRTIVDRASWDHPRVCGEHMFNRAIPLIDRGSSPRMRGALPPHADCTPSLRIIPAYAGSTTAGPWTPGDDKDHPRVCGEHASGSVSSLCQPGSSPRMRGARARTIRRTIPTRIIPAYAGSTHHRRRVCSRGGDHPRVCGEHPMSATAYQTQEGSSPRMRGAPDPN